MVHSHLLTYIIKIDDNKNYTGRIIEIPAIIIQGKSIDEIDTKITKAATHYIKTFESEHIRLISKKEPTPKMTDSGYGYIIQAKQFSVNCFNEP